MTRMNTTMMIETTMTITTTNDCDKVNYDNVDDCRKHQYDKIDHN